MNTKMQTHNRSHRVITSRLTQLFLSTLIVVVSLQLVGCSSQSQLAGRWTNSTPPDTSQGFNYRTYLVSDPAGWVSVEFLGNLKINVTKRWGENSLHTYNVISAARLELMGKLFDFQVDGNRLKLTDSNGRTATFRK